MQGCESLKILAREVRPATQKHFNDLIMTPKRGKVESIVTVVKCEVTPSR
jgi:hypothetical protein